MFNLDNIANENNKEHNEKWTYIPDDHYRILITGGSESAKTNTLLNLRSQQDDIDKIYLYVKDLSEPKYDDFLIKNREDAGIKHLNDLNKFIECSNTMDQVYENIDDDNPTIKKNLVVFDDIISDIMNFKPQLKNYLLDAEMNRVA